MYLHLRVVLLSSVIFFSRQEEGAWRAEFTLALKQTEVWSFWPHRDPVQGDWRTESHARQVAANWAILLLHKYFMQFYNNLMRLALNALDMSNAHKSDQDVEQWTRGLATCLCDLLQIRIRAAKVPFFYISFFKERAGDDAAL